MPSTASTAGGGEQPQIDGHSRPRISDYAERNGGPPSGKEHRGQNGGQPSRRQRLGLEGATTANNRFARITNPPCPAGCTEGMGATAMEDVPRRKEAFKQLVTMISGRRATTDTHDEGREQSASGKAKGYQGVSREQLASGKAKVRQSDRLQEQPWKKTRTTSGGGRGDCLVQ